MSGATKQELEALYVRHYSYFVRVATGILRDEDRGADAVQEAFAAAIRRRRDFRRDGPLEAWVWRIVVNAARRARPNAPPAHLDTHVEPADEESPVRDAVAQLPERQRLVLFLRYYADLDYASIAAALEIAPGTVAASLHAARVVETPPRGGTHMTEDTLIRDELDALVADTQRTPNWDDVVRRAHRPVYRRPLALLLVALVAVGSGAVVAAATGGFGKWLSGEPGKPAPAEEQKRFKAENGQSWLAFPTGTKLRELLRTNVRGAVRPVRIPQRGLALLATELHRGARADPRVCANVDGHADERAGGAGRRQRDAGRTKLARERKRVVRDRRRRRHARERARR